MADKYGIIILAAGQSSRLGRPKQLVSFNGITLLDHTISQAKKSTISAIYVVLGARYDEISKKIASEDIFVVQNELWSEGIASSIRSGLRTLISTQPNINKVVFLVCDQPFLSSSLIDKLVATSNSSNLPIVASQYEGILGTPALFDSSIFEELLSLSGDVGAGRIIKKHSERVAIVDFEQGHFDIDTEAEVNILDRIICQIADEA